MNEKNVVDFFDKETLEDQAASWLIRMDGDDDLTQAELSELEQWRSQSPAHRAKLDELAAVWGNANILTELAVPIDKPIEQPQQRAATQKWWGAGALAASLLIALAVFNFSDFYQPPMHQSNGIYATQIGQRQSQTLSDGSQIQLNTDTEIRVDFNKEFRDIYLVKGEAHFEVAKNEQVPFRVFAGTGRIRAVGTAFSVYLKDNNVDVVVSEGRVALAKIAATYLPQLKEESHQDIRSVGKSDAKKLGQLKAGEAVTIIGQAASVPEAPSEDLIKIEQVDVSKRISWTKGILVFSGETLEEVVSELGRYTDVSIEFAEPELKLIRIGGRFPTGEAEIMLAALESNVGLQVRRINNSRVVISDPNN